MPGLGTAVINRWPVADVYQLGLSRHAPAILKTVARAIPTFAFAAQTLSELAGSDWAFRELDFRPLEGFRACNPSITRHGGALFCSVRTFEGQPSGIVNRNFLLELDQDGGVTSSSELLCRQGLPNSAYHGPEDVRLFSYQGELWGSFTVADHHLSGLGQIGLARLDKHGFGDIVVQDFGGYRLQKNWMPFVDNEGLGWIYQCDPTIVLRYHHGLGQAVEWKRWQPFWALDGQRGGSQLVPWDDGWLCVTHETIHRTRRFYLHRFMRMDANFAVTGLSRPFHLVRPGVEFCSGLCRRKGGEFWLSFGLADSQAMLGVIKEEAVRRLLMDCPPSVELGTPVLGYDYWKGRLGL